MKDVGNEAYVLKSDPLISGLFSPAGGGGGVVSSRNPTKNKLLDGSGRRLRKIDVVSWWGKTERTWTT
ncbi:hypothetical protein C1H46_023313 [Malus baccata]|uniref:Uncharacterized protein n=1 Tax=Malus baccata TaxID=106549 RepID=A0A540LXM5_MALBA|nr:hypothetical protein C1H46_023313 [Malus baccata]